MQQGPVAYSAYALDANEVLPPVTQQKGHKVRRSPLSSFVSQSNEVEEVLGRCPGQITRSLGGEISLVGQVKIVPEFRHYSQEVRRGCVEFSRTRYTD